MAPLTYEQVNIGWTEPLRDLRNAAAARRYAGLKLVTGTHTPHLGLSDRLVRNLNSAVCVNYRPVLGETLFSRVKTNFPTPILEPRNGNLGTQHHCNTLDDVWCGLSERLVHSAFLFAISVTIRGAQAKNLLFAFAGLLAANSLRRMS